MLITILTLLDINGVLESIFQVRSFVTKFVFEALTSEISVLNPTEVISSVILSEFRKINDI